MAKGDVIGVAAYPEEGPHVVRLQVEDGDGGETAGDRVVWVPASPEAARPWVAGDGSTAGAWHAVKADSDVTDDERRRFRARPVPGDKLERQPPQRPVKLPQEVVDRGVAAKAAAFVNQGDRTRAGEYLANRVSVGLIDGDTAERIAAQLEVRIDKAAMREAAAAREALIRAGRES